MASNKDRTANMRARLIEAARALFCEAGFAETSTPEIVRRAGVTRGAMYHHFTDKTDLMRAVVEAEAQGVADEINRRSADQGNALAALTFGAAAYFEAMQVPGRAKLLLIEGPSALGLEEIRRIDRETGGQTLAEGLAQALPNHAPRSTPIPEMADVLSAAFDRAAIAIADGADPAEYSRAIEVLLKALIDADAA